MSHSFDLPTDQIEYHAVNAGWCLIQLPILRFHVRLKTSQLLYCLVKSHSKPEHSPFANYSGKKCVSVLSWFMAGYFFAVSRKVTSSARLRNCAATFSWSFTGEATNNSRWPPGGFRSQLANPYESFIFQVCTGILSCGLFWSSAPCRFAAHSIHWMMPLKLDGKSSSKTFYKSV